MDQGILQSLKEFEQGSPYGPFATHKEFIASLHAEAKKLRTKGFQRGRLEKSGK